MKARRTSSSLSLFSCENSEERQNIAELFMDILAEVQYVRLIVAKSPKAKVVSEVRAILAARRINGKAPPKGGFLSCRCLGSPF